MQLRRVIAVLTSSLLLTLSSRGVASEHRSRVLAVTWGMSSPTFACWTAPIQISSLLFSL